MTKKVLFLITKSNFGGAQRYVYELAKGLPKKDFEAVAAYGGDGPLAEKLRLADIKTISLPFLQRDISLFKELKSFFALRKILQQEKPDIFHINSSKAGAIGALAGHLVGIPKIIFTAHGWAFNEDRPLWQRLILKKIHWLTVLLSHKTIAVSEEVKRQMNWPFVQSKIVVIHNGREIENLLSHNESRAFITEHEPRLALFTNDFWTMTIAELHPVKRHKSVIEVMAELKASGEKIRHLIIGSGEQYKTLHSLIKKLELEDTVFLLGNIDEASRYLKAADCFILASRSEAMPYTIIESMIAGIPTIATFVGGIPEMIEDGVSGLLVSPLDNKALFEAILKVKQDNNLRERLSHAAQKKSTEFSLEKALQQTTALYLS